MVDSIPNDLVVSPRCYTPTNCKHQFSIKCFFQQSENFSTLFIVWQIGMTVCSWEVYATSFSWMHLIRYTNSAALRVSITMGKIINSPVHYSLRLISNHFPKYCGTNRTFNPLFFPFQHLEAPIMHDMATFKSYQIFLGFIQKLFFLSTIIDVIILKLTDTALLARWLFTLQLKLEMWEK